MSVMDYLIFYREGTAVPPYDIEEVATFHFPIEGSRLWDGRLLINEEYLDDDTFYAMLQAYNDYVSAEEYTYCEWLPQTYYCRDGIPIGILKNSHKVGDNSITILIPIKE